MRVFAIHDGGPEGGASPPLLHGQIVAPHQALDDHLHDLLVAVDIQGRILRIKPQSVDATSLSGSLNHNYQMVN